VIKFDDIMKMDEIVDVVCENRPELKQLFLNGMNISLYEYYIKTANVQMINSSIKQDIIDIIFKLIKDRNIEIDENEFKNEFSINFTTSTADHHGPLTHSFFYNSTLLETILFKNINRKYIIHLPCAGVSISNSSYPRGFLFYNEKKVLSKIPLFSILDGRKAVYALKMNPNFISKNLNSLNENIQKSIVPLIPDLNTYTDKTYEEIITFINFKIWEKLNNGKVKLITIDQESVVRELLLLYIDKNIDIKNLLFTKNGRENYINIFSGAVGAHDSISNKGTHFFWYVGENSREKLWLNNENLISESGKIIPLDISFIKENLINKKIYPCMSLTFIILNCFGGLRTEGGFCQINYLPEIQNKFKEYAKIMNIKSHIYFPNPSIFRGEFEFVEENIGKTPLDLILDNNENHLENIEEKSKKITLQKSLTFMMNEFYKITTGKYPNK